MTRNTLLAGLGLLMAPLLIAVGQITIEPPPVVETAPASTSATAATEPTQTGASTLPTAENVLESLLHKKPALTPVAPSVTATGSVVPALTSAVPGDPKGKVMRERDMVEKRVGRLVKDEKTSNWVFVFEADGQEMADAPLTILPSSLLEAMEKLSDKGTRPVKFRISGEVTQYRGQNFLLVRYAQIVKDLNQGLGG
jgi:hypothetical protein